MVGPEGNSECFPLESLCFPRLSIEILEKQNSLFLEVSVMICYIAFFRREKK